MPKIELKKKWWLTCKPKEIKGAELEKVLGQIEQAAEDKRAAALSALPPAIAKACKELDKNKHKDLLKDLAALEKLADSEMARLQAAVRQQAKAQQESEADAGDDETPPDKLFDVELHRQTIKRALKQPLVFAFAIASKPEACVLALSVRGNPLTFARLAKAESNVPKVACGTLQAAAEDLRKLVLTLAGTPVSGIVKSLRAYLQKNKITVFRKISVIVDGKEAEAESLEEETPGSAAAPGEMPAPAPPVEEASEPPPTPKQLEVLEDRRREFKKARTAWVAVKERAEMDLEKVKDGARDAYLADAEQFPKIVAGCKEIDTILDNLDDELRDLLDQYASTPLRQQKKLLTLAASAKEILDRYLKFVSGSPLMKAIDEKEFADVAVHAPVMKALTVLRRTLS